MLRKLPVILALLGLGSALPSSRFDQRQEGGVNVKVDLDNIAIVVASVPSPLDFLGSLGSIGLLAGERNSQSQQQAEGAKEPELESKSELEDVSLDKPVEKPEEQPKMQVLVVQSAEKAAETVGEIVRTLRNLKEKQEEQPRGISGKYKFVDSVDEPQNLKLIGDAVENCGPGRSRDRLGICQGDRLAEE